LISIFGSNLGIGNAVAQAIPLPTNLNGTTVRINGTLSAPLYFVSPDQVNMQMPWDASGASVSVEVDVNGVSSNSIMIDLAQQAPALFTVNQRGFGQGALSLLHARTRLDAQTVETLRSFEYLGVK
jgi:uncharacterized protein (TIGR03437 family)